MRKKIAFTLAEVLVTMAIIGILITLVISNLTTSGFDEKASNARAYKALDVIEQAFLTILLQETGKCPSGNFIINNELALYSTDTGNTKVNATNLRTIVGNYLKYESNNVNMCSLYQNCSNTLGGNVTVGMKLLDGMYLGFEVLNNVANCPSFYVPDANLTAEANVSSHSAPTVWNGSNFEVDKCWGKIYIDTNGKDAPNQQGRDIFIFGLNGKGIAR